MNNTINTVYFYGTECEIKKGYYSNGRIALQLIDIEDGSLVTVATVNIPEEDLDDNEVIIKDYSENEGMLDVLTDNGIVEFTGKIVETGFVLCPVCILKI